jgi:hypothetical protein
MFLIGAIALLANRASAGDDPSDPLNLYGPPGNPPKTEKVTYLGVTAKPVDDALRAQLNLADGTGLTVMTVDHKGPAGDDIKPTDVLLKLDDQLLIDSHQLVTLIRLHKPGDTVTLTIIREAKPMQVKIKLGEKERTVKADAPDQSPDAPGVSDAKIPDDHSPTIPFDVTLPGVNIPQVGITFKDDTYTATVKTNAQGHKHMIVKNMANLVVAEGPIDTAEEWNKFPADVRKHLEVMHKVIVDQK